MVKCLPTMRETQVQSLGREDLLEKEMAPHSSILAWKIPWMEESGRLQSMGSQRVGHDWATSLTSGQRPGRLIVHYVWWASLSSRSLFCNTACRVCRPPVPLWHHPWGTGAWGTSMNTVHQPLLLQWVMRPFVSELRILFALQHQIPSRAQ